MVVVPLARALIIPPLCWLANTFRGKKRSACRLQLEPTPFAAPLLMQAVLLLVLTSRVRAAFVPRSCCVRLAAEQSSPGVRSSSLSLQGSPPRGSHSRLPRRRAHRQLLAEPMLAQRVRCVRALLVCCQLRGAIAFALARNAASAHQRTIIAATTAVILFTTFILGGLTRTMLKWLRLLPSSEGGAAGGPSRRRDGGGLARRWAKFDARFMAPIFGGAPPLLPESRAVDAFEVHERGQHLETELEALSGPPPPASE